MPKTFKIVYHVEFRVREVIIKKITVDKYSSLIAARYPSRARVKPNKIGRPAIPCPKLASIAWLQAQQYPPDTSKQTGSSQKIEGCLQGSDGNFTLTDRSGTTYQLQGDTAKLTEHVGHDVQITAALPEGPAIAPIRQVREPRHDQV